MQVDQCKSYYNLNLNIKALKICNKNETMEISNTIIVNEAIDVMNAMLCKMFKLLLRRSNAKVFI